MEISVEYSAVSICCPCMFSVEVKVLSPLFIDGEGVIEIKVTRGVF